MPTQAQLQQANALRKANPSLSIKDSVSQVLSPPAPVAQANPPVTPPTPTATPPQTMQGVNGETFQVAPTNAQGISTPTQPTTPSAPTPTPAPVTTPAPTTTPPTPTAPVDETTTIKAKNEAQMALNKQKAELRQAERDKETGVQTAEALKVKQEAEAQLANNEGAILGTLRAGGIIPEAVKSSPYYKSAQNTYNKLQQFSVYSTADLTTALNTGALLPGTSVYNEMLRDPAMKTKLTTAQMYTVGQPVNTSQVFQNVSNEILSNNPNTANYLADGVITQQEYNQATNNTEVVAKAKDVETKTNSYNTLKAEYDAIEDEVKAQFPGSAFTDSIIADRQKAKYKNLVLAKGEVDSAIGTLTEIKSQAANLFETNLKLYQDQKKSEDAYKMADYQAKLGLQAKGAELQMTADFNKKQAEQALNDPATAIQSVMDEYKKLGIPFTSTVQSRLAEFKNSGLSLPDFLTKMNKNIQASPGYQTYQRLQNGQLSDAQKMQAQQSFDIQKIKLQDSMKDKNIQRVGGTTENPIYGYIDGNKIVTVNIPGTPTVTGGTVIPPTPEAIKSISSRLTGNNVQCGMVTNDYTAKVFPGASHIDDTYESKVKAVESIGVSDVPQVGGIFALNTYNSNGHTGVVQSVDLANGTFTATDANRAGSQNGGPVTTSTYKISPNFTFSNGPQVNTDVKLTDKQFTQYNQTKTGFKSEPIVKTFEDALVSGGDIIASLGSENGPGDVGAVFNFMKALDPSSTVREGEFALAAKSAGVWESFKNIPANKLEGTILTDKQRKDFGKLAMKYIESKGKLYDTKYDDMTKVLKNQGIPESYYPTRMTDYIKQYENNVDTPQNSSNPTSIPPAIYAGFESDFNDL